MNEGFSLFTKGKGNLYVTNEVNIVFNWEALGGIF